MQAPLTVRIAAWSARHRWPVFALWFAATLGMLAGSMAAGGIRVPGERPVVGPAMTLLRDWNWWLPRWLGWLPHITIEAESAEPEPSDGVAAAARAAGA